MSLIIKGMQLPRKSEHRECSIAVVQNRPVSIAFSRTTTNPLECFECAEIPTPHGRLIDADNLVKVLQNTLDNYPDNYNDEKTVEKLIVTVCKRYIENTPTVIEAEVSE